jgi:hypothetical protein
VTHDELGRVDEERSQPLGVIAQGKIDANVYAAVTKVTV